ncbi:hypothetical protein WA158_004357 [Blastocystis sp. Blastoise]
MNKVDPELVSYIDSISKKAVADADEIINYTLPEKIKKLSTITQEVLLSVTDGYEECPIDIYAPVIECNPQIMKLLIQVKNELYDFLEICVSLKFWIQLNIPKIEEGNNFGVEVQGGMLDMLDSGRSSASHILELLSSYFSDRGETIQDWQKSPYIDDIKVNLRNTYTVLYDKIQKNYEKIKKPKGSHHDHNHFEMMY